MTILDFLPTPGGRVEAALRASEFVDRREQKQAEEHQRALDGREQDRQDAFSYALLSGRSVPTHADVLLAASRLGDLEDQREERKKANASSRAEQLEERANVLRSQRDTLRRSENTRLNVDRQTRLADERDSARRAADAAARGSRRYR